MTRLDFINIYNDLSTQSDIVPEATEFVSDIVNELFIPEKIEYRLRGRLTKLNERIECAEDRENYYFKSLVLKSIFLADILKLLFGDIEEAPLQINGVYSSIAKLRLAQG
jgi:hypothetical protein